MLHIIRVLNTRNNVVRSLIYGRFKGVCELYNGRYIVYDRVITYLYTLCATLHVR